MRPLTQLAWISALAAVMASPVAAMEDDFPDVPLPTIQIPEAYATGNAPDSVTNNPDAAQSVVEEEVVAGDEDIDRSQLREGASALNGALYAVIAPTFDGSNVTSSFFRFVNGGASTSTFSVTVVGSPSGDTYGTAMIDVPTRASPQFSLSGIRDLAGASGLVNGDTSFALYIQNADPGSGYQHVIFNSENSFFENASICKTTFDEALESISNSKVLTNVHTSLLGPWPSQIEIHNFFNAQTTYLVSVVEAGAGTVMGQVNVEIGANASYSMPFTFFEDSVGWEPASGESHANLVVSDPSGATPSIVLGHSILNNELAANINMSLACAVNEPTDSGMGGGFGDGGFSY